MTTSSFSTAFKGPGHVVTIAAPYARLGGQGAQIGTAFFGVAAKDLANAEVGPFCVEGSWSLAKNNVATAMAVGDRMYWDNTNKRLDTVSTSNLLVGVCVVAAGATDTTVTVVLTGQV
jgi:predicted RecA/RadA family phage recombinase